MGNFVRLWYVYVLCWMYKSFMPIVYNECTFSGWDRVVNITFCFTMACEPHLVPFTSYSKTECVCLYVYCGTCPRSGPNWTELLGQWGELVMLPAASTMERSTPSYWSLEGWITITQLCRTHGSWMSTLGGGGR